MKYELLGPLRLVDCETHTITAPKMETLLATLLIRANQPVSTGELINELWGDRPPRRARAALHVYVSQLRKNFVRGDASIKTHAQGYLMEIDDSTVDVFHLQRLHTAGRAVLEAEPESALASLQAAARLYRGPVLAGIGDGLIVGAFARWAEEVRLECLEGIADCALRVGRHRELVGALSAWVNEYPLNETLREHLMLALHRSGRRAEALEAYHSARRVLQEELGLDPRDTMRRLQLAILEADTDYAIAS
ncbi:AfsR/SARP family transcriptional regulator [Actinomadura fulvescens]|uniref:AfsR/SARP family transcriptional regulator n=1 Tax=Actinomadura fulvescens TaxID=46160 RepID=A0ABN3PHJ7_9ACTN